MAFSINRVTLLGNATQDAELRYTPNGQPVTKIGIATNRSFKDEHGDWKDRPTFHRVTIWGKLAEYVAKIITKGMRVYIDGRLNYSSSEKDGQKKYYTDIVARNVIPMARVKSQPAETAQTPDQKPGPEPKPPTGEKPEGEIDPKNIPF